MDDDNTGIEVPADGQTYEVNMDTGSVELVLPGEPELVVPDSAEHANLDLTKLKCVEDESAEEHEAHKGELEAAYAAFAARSGAGQESNPAPPGQVTQLEAHATMDLGSAV